MAKTVNIRSTNTRPQPAMNNRIVAILFAVIALFSVSAFASNSEKDSHLSFPGKIAKMCFQEYKDKYPETPLKSYSELESYVKSKSLSIEDVCPRTVENSVEEFTKVAMGMGVGMIALLILVILLVCAVPILICVCCCCAAKAGAEAIADHSSRRV